MEKERDYLADEDEWSDDDEDINIPGNSYFPKDLQIDRDSLELLPTNNIPQHPSQRPTVKFAKATNRGNSPKSPLPTPLHTTQTPR